VTRRLLTDTAVGSSNLCSYHRRAFDRRSWKCPDPFGAPPRWCEAHVCTERNLWRDSHSRVWSLGL